MVNDGTAVQRDLDNLERRLGAMLLWLGMNSCHAAPGAFVAEGADSA